MLRNLYQATLIAFSTIYLVGCATPNVALPDSFWQNKKQKIVVASTTPPTPGVTQMGNQGLLDYAINSAMNNNFDAYLKHVNLAWYHNTPQTFATKLKERHIAAFTYSQALPSNQSNYTSIANQSNSDMVLLIKLEAVGAKRDYAGFLPTDAPKAYCLMTGELINAADNKVMWHYQTNVAEPIQGAWDQAPNYPNFSNALKVAENSAKQELMDSFFSGH